MIEIPENTFVDLYAQARPEGFRSFYPHPKQVEMCGKEWPIEMKWMVLSSASYQA